MKKSVLILRFNHLYLKAWMDYTIRPVQQELELQVQENFQMENQIS